LGIGHVEAVENATGAADIDAELGEASGWAKLSFTFWALHPLFGPGHHDRLAVKQLRRLCERCAFAEQE